MTGDIAERKSTASISWRALRSAFSMRSRVTGSSAAVGDGTAPRGSVRAVGRDGAAVSAARTPARATGRGAATSPAGERADIVEPGRGEADAGPPGSPVRAVWGCSGDSPPGEGVASPLPSAPPVGSRRAARSPFEGGSRSESSRADSPICVSKMRSKRALFAFRRSSREMFRSGGVSSAMSRLPIAMCGRRSRERGRPARLEDCAPPAHCGRDARAPGDVSRMVRLECRNHGASGPVGRISAA